MAQRKIEFITYNPSNANVRRSISVRVTVSTKDGEPQVKLVRMHRAHHVPGKGILHHSGAATRRDMLVF
jgi:hypothetical protein